MERRNLPVLYQEPLRESPSSSRWITRRGKLGGEGYTHRSDAERHALLDDCVQRYGYQSCLGSILALERSRSIAGKYGHLLAADREYLTRTYGGEGSFGPRVERLVEPMMEPLEIIERDEDRIVGSRIQSILFLKDSVDPDGYSQREALKWIKKHRKKLSDILHGVDPDRLAVEPDGANARYWHVRLYQPSDVVPSTYGTKTIKFRDGKPVILIRTAVPHWRAEQQERMEHLHTPEHHERMESPHRRGRIVVLPHLRGAGGPVEVGYGYDDRGRIHITYAALPGHGPVDPEMFHQHTGITPDQLSQAVADHLPHRDRHTVPGWTYLWADENERLAYGGEDVEHLRIREFDALMGEGQQFGVMSAYGKKSKHENQLRNGRLVGLLQGMGYREVHPVRGSWMGVAEKSILIPNITFGELVRLGREFEQDSVIYKDPTGVVGMYYLKTGEAEIAVRRDGSIASAIEVGRGLYSKSRGTSFEFGFLWGQRLGWDGRTPFTRRGVQRFIDRGLLAPA